MRKTNSRMFVLFFAVCLAGCIQVDQSLTLQPDGSGILEWQYGIRQEALERIGTNLAPGTVPFAGGAGLPDEAAIRAGFRDMEPQGIVLESVSREIRDGCIYWDLRVRFDGLENLARSPLMAGQTMSLLRDAADNYVFQQSGGFPGPDAARSPEEQDAERRWMAGFRASVKITTPGRILEANAGERTEYSATWVYDLEKDPDVLHKAGTAIMRVVFDGKDLKLPCFATGM